MRKMVNKIKCLYVILSMMSVTFMASAQSCPDNNHPHDIDLGLPSGTKWACCNMGASNPMDNGGYYAWGETEEKETYDWENYIYYSNGTVQDIGSNIAGTQYDVAHVKWGGSWMIPSMEQIQELFDHCTYTYTRIETDGAFGGLFTGPNGNAIFLPPAHPIRNGNSQDDDILDNGNSEMNSANDEMPPHGAYWSSNPKSPDSTAASCFFFSFFDTFLENYSNRAEGLSVRPVTKGQESSNSTDLLSEMFLHKWCLWLRHDDGRMDHKYIIWHGNKTFGDKSYHVIRDPYIDGQYFYCRFADDKLYRYDETVNKEYVLCDFSLKKGDEFKRRDGHTMLVKETSDTTITDYLDDSHTYGTYKTLSLVNVDDSEDCDQWLEGFGSLYTSVMSPSELGDNLNECRLLWCDEFLLYRFYDTEHLKTQMMCVEKTDDNMIETDYGKVTGPDSLRFEFDGNTLVISGTTVLICSWHHYLSCDVNDNVITFRIDCIEDADCISRHFFTARFPGFKEGEYVVRYEGLYESVIEANVVCGENHPVVGVDSVEQGKKVIGVPSYDLSGRHLTSEPRQGIYIKDGRKYVK